MMTYSLIAICNIFLAVFAQFKVVWHREPCIVWLQTLHILEDEAAVEAENVWSLTRENFEDCLGPSKKIASKQFRKNLR